MKIPAFGWALVALAIIALIGYGLSRGVYIGSTIDVSTRQGEGKFLYSKSCRYLFLDGVHDIAGSAETLSREDSERAPCALLGNSS
jgi:hypothetical protein